MMAFLHGKSASVLVDTYDLSSYLNNASSQSQVATGETTAFGAGSKTYIVGLKDGTLSLGGLFDGAAGAVDQLLAGMLAVENHYVVAVPQGSGIGNRAIMAQADLTSYNITTPVADVVSIQADFQADGGVDSGVVLHNLTAETATGSSTSVDNTALTANGGVAILNVTANTRNGTTIIKVQHSVDNTTWADLVTHTTVATSTTATERVVVAAGTTVNRYLRANFTLAGSTGSITFNLAFARR